VSYPEMPAELSLSQAWIIAGLVIAFLISCGWQRHKQHPRVIWRYRAAFTVETQSSASMLGGLYPMMDKTLLHFAQVHRAFRRTPQKASDFVV
jgi:hypothetical protein